MQILVLKSQGQKCSTNSGPKVFLSLSHKNTNDGKILFNLIKVWQLIEDHS